MSNIRRLEFVKLPYLDEKSSDFDEIWYTTAAWELDNSHVTKYIFFNSRWRTAAILKIVFGPKFRKLKLVHGRHLANH